MSNINLLLGCLWLRSMIAHNKFSEAEQLLGPFQYIIFFALYQKRILSVGQYLICVIVRKELKPLLSVRQYLI